MKTLAFFSLVFALFFTACQEDDFARPEFGNTGLQSNNTTIDNLDGTSLIAANCKQIVTNHSLFGKPTWSTDASNPWYAINAYGNAVLNGGAVGRSELVLKYDQATRAFSGRLVARFAAGDMEHTFYGVANPLADAGEDDKVIIEGQTNKVSGVMTTSFGILKLASGGVLKISVLPGDEGDAIIGISIAGLYCSSTKVFSTK